MNSDPKIEGNVAGPGEPVLRHLLPTAIDEAFVVIEMIHDAPGNPVDWRFREANAAFEAHTGLRSVVGKTLLEVVPGLEEEWSGIYAEVARTGRSIRFTRRAETLGRSFEVFAFRMGEAPQRLVGVLFSDVTAIEAAMKALREGEEREAFLLKLSDALRPLRDPFEVQKEAARRLGERLGVERAFYAEIEGSEAVVRSCYASGVRSLTGRLAALRLGTGIEAAARGGETLVVRNAFQDERIPEDQREVYQQMEAAAFVVCPLVKEGVWVATFSVHSAIPRSWTDQEVRLLEEVAERGWAAVERARAEASLRENEEKYRVMCAAAERRAAELQAVIESMNDAVYIGGIDGITLANQVALDQLGFTTREELNRHVGTLAQEIETRDWQTGEMISAEGQAFTRALHGEHVVQDVRVRHRQSKEDRVVRSAAAPVVIDGQVIAAVAVNTDVTEQRRAEAALNKSEGTLRAFVNASADVIYRMNPDCSILYRLRGGELSSGAEVPEENWMNRYVFPDDREHVRQKIKDAVAAKSDFQLEHRVIRADGSVGWTASRAIPMLDDQGEITEWFGTASDITLRKNAEAALIASEKLAVVGRLASSIAHEINNPLEAVINLIYLAEGTSIPTETRNFLEMAQAELQRVAHIASETLRFHRQSTRAAETILKDVSESVLTLHQGRLDAESISVQRRYRQTTPVLAFANDLRQVVANLVTNAIDAMKQSSRRHLYVRTRQGSDRSSNIPGLWFTIADTGSGMDAATRARIFDPFFTTKGNVGTGLGMWVAGEIVSKHGGKMLVRSRQKAPHSGTVFLLFLPNDAGGQPHRRPDLA